MPVRLYSIASGPATIAGGFTSTELSTGLQKRRGAGNVKDGDDTDGLMGDSWLRVVHWGCGISASDLQSFRTD